MFEKFYSNNQSDMLLRILTFNFQRKKTHSNSLTEVSTEYGLLTQGFIIFLLLFGLWGYWPCGHSWPIVPASGDSEYDCAEADGM
jgi:hypothetical protein